MAVKAGGSLFGRDAGKWPAWWSDAIDVLTLEQTRANAIQGAAE